MDHSLPWLYLLFTLVVGMLPRGGRPNSSRTSRKYAARKDFILMYLKKVVVQKSPGNTNCVWNDGGGDGFVSNKLNFFCRWRRATETKDRAIMWFYSLESSATQRARLKHCCGVLEIPARKLRFSTITNLAILARPSPADREGMHLQEEQTRIPPGPKVNFRRASRKDVWEWRERVGGQGGRTGWHRKKGIRATRVYEFGRKEERMERREFV